MTFQPWALLIGAPPLLVFFLLIREIKHDKSRTKQPFKDALLRPPGESCRLKLEALNEELTDRLLILLGPFALGLIISFTSSVGPYACLIVFLLSAFFSWFAARRLKQTLKQIRNYRLGFEGERAVGQQLNEALSRGCKVYHDVQFDGYNIDHVIIAPSGVYAVETKTRRKGLEKNSHKVRYDGQKLIFPGWEDAHDLEQAQGNAKSLAVWLSGAVGERVWVEPILTLPGWWIDCVGTGTVNVLNPKQIIDFVTPNSQRVLSEPMIQRISYQLEQKNVIS